jgi:hypothetical protein
MGSCSKGRCVRDTVKEIIRAQNEVAERDNCCDVSCERSIRELLSPATADNGNTTIPFTLICKDCKPFIGNGLKHYNGSYHCIKTPFFRAKKFVEGSNSCVKLELLKPMNTQPPCVLQERKHDKKDVCDFVNGLTGFYETGVCITVDLDCFCGISCLRPTTPVPFNNTAAQEEAHHAE